MEPTQQMGGGAGLVLPDGGGVHGHAGEPPLLDGGDDVDVHILGEDILLLVDLIGAQVDLVEHADEGPGVLVRPGGVDLKIIAQGGNELLRRGHGGDLGEILGRLDVPGVGQVEGLLHRASQGQGVEQAAQPGEGHTAVGQLVGQGGVGGVGEGGGGGDGQAVRPGQAVVPADGDELHQVGVALGLVPHEPGVQGDAVHRPVGHQLPAVPVQQLPPGALHGDPVVDFHHRHGPVVLHVDDLQVVEHADEYRQYHSQHRRHGQSAPVELLSLHGTSFLFYDQWMPLRPRGRGPTARFSWVPGGTPTGTGRTPGKRIP